MMYRYGIRSGRRSSVNTNYMLDTALYANDPVHTAAMTDPAAMKSMIEAFSLTPGHGKIQSEITLRGLLLRGPVGWIGKVSGYRAESGGVGGVSHHCIVIRGFEKYEQLYLNISDPYEPNVGDDDITLGWDELWSKLQNTQYFTI